MAQKIYTVDEIARLVKKVEFLNEAESDAEYESMLDEVTLDMLISSSTLDKYIDWSVDKLHYQQSINAEVSDFLSSLDFSKLIPVDEA